ncbi:Transposon Ty3-I Gag-Pol polyprotein [Cucumis melo var. makuwa]|uniref:Transposon Ty3-I Gag-Pol polyprotein n=1 Tax=Cucumis melo var. makuwa TaxID=1194695 RepID=A0A5D3CY29_CUCMM|nr:Transposon Ty3-I Gag-Pol polyprotein [Cucumis melo var. makuwa]TYK16823.1 Transposon Ty3-I Gag-Pol polyprotein [Cucumis melo var. makuwa]
MGQSLRHKQVIGWSLEDLKGIDPSFCTHRIHLKEGAKNKVQPQRHLNLTLKEVVKKEVLKLKDANIIYLVPHSTWLSYFHHLPNAYCPLVERPSSKDVDNECQEEFGDNLHFGKITSIICTPERGQVWAIGAERLLFLIEKFYTFYK